MKWDPDNPQYYDALGTLTHRYANGDSPNDTVELYEKTALLGPHDAQFWADLGAAYDWAGRTDEALSAFQRARHLFPNSPEINWRLANFYVRTGKTPEALRAMQAVLRGDSGEGRSVFALATRATGDTNAILAILPLQAPAEFDARLPVLLSWQVILAGSVPTVCRPLQCSSAKEPWDLPNS